MNDMILLKEGEVVLKGLNRRFFEQKLLENVRRRLKPYGAFTVTGHQSVIYIEPKDDAADMDGAFEAMKKVFGILRLTRAAACEKTPEAILEKAKEYLADELRTAKTFKVESKRSDKGFPMTSIQLSQYVGGELNEAFPNLKADMHEPELTVWLEAARPHSRHMINKTGMIFFMLVLLVSGELLSFRNYTAFFSASQGAPGDNLRKKQSAAELSAADFGWLICEDSTATRRW